MLLDGWKRLLGCEAGVCFVFDASCFLLCGLGLRARCSGGDNDMYHVRSALVGDFFVA